MTDLKDKVVLVTGGSRGIGAGIVTRLVAAGAYVVIHFNQSENHARDLALETNISPEVSCVISVTQCCAYPERCALS